ncbi:hypothetical protein SLS56_002448 [Neofusicoccum ribis]|uniref:Uncharacterized protein n=1 Tax=Neofusicoccum ribis TaxID=45134 RepID=A0ABR3T3J8_9PEZI
MSKASTPLSPIQEQRETPITSPKAMDEAMIKLPPHSESPQPRIKRAHLRSLEEKIQRLLNGKRHLSMKVAELDAYMELCRLEMDVLCREAYGYKKT